MPTPGAAELEVLDSIQRRVLWLATWMVHHANFGRENPEGTKVGGHQASSASVVTLLTALYFRALRSTDLVAVKAHGSPAFYACHYLRGNLDRALLPQLPVEVARSEEHTSELQSRVDLVCRLLLEKKKIC